MVSEAATPSRRRPGRPRQITPERIVEAGIALTLPQLTVTGVAAALGVSTVALHQHIDGIDGLRRMVAEEILRRHPPAEVAGDGLVDDLVAFSLGLRRFVHANPGIGEYLARIDSSSTHGLVHIDQVHTRFAAAYDLTPTQAAWLVGTVAEHAIALAELVYTRQGRPRHHPDLIPTRTDLTTLPKVLIRRPDHDDDWFFTWSMRATVVGAVELIGTLP